MLEAWQWTIIGIIAVIFILWGPAKIPEFAKALFELNMKKSLTQTKTPQTSSSARISFASLKAEA